MSFCILYCIAFYFCNVLITLAWFQETMQLYRISLVTTDPTKTIAPSCIVTLGIINTFEEMNESSSIIQKHL